MWEVDIVKLRSLIDPVQQLSLNTPTILTFPDPASYSKSPIAKFHFLPACTDRKEELFYELLFYKYLVYCSYCQLLEMIAGALFFAIFCPQIFQFLFQKILLPDTLMSLYK